METAAGPRKNAGDLDGDGKADLIFQNAAGDLAVWKHNPDGTISGATLPGAGTWILRAVMDVDGNGISDLVWQAPDGTVASWFMNAPVTPAGNFVPGGAGIYKVRAGGRCPPAPAPGAAFAPRPVSRPWKRAALFFRGLEL